MSPRARSTSPSLNSPDEVAAADRSRLAAGARGDLGIDHPAEEAASVHRRDLSPAAPEIAATRLPGGADYYQGAGPMVDEHRAISREIHEIGQQECSGSARPWTTSSGRRASSGSLPDFVKLLHTDPRFAPVPPDQVLPAFRDIASRVDPELPKLFAELPRMPYGIREIPAFRGQTAEHYTPGASDGSRAGYFNAMTLRGATRPRHEMEALLLHEAVPGHHLQSLAQELKGLPDFRRNARYSAPTAKGGDSTPRASGEDLGLYKDPYSKFGRLQNEILRACRTVVDTGMQPGLEP